MRVASKLLIAFIAFLVSTTNPKQTNTLKTVTNQLSQLARVTNGFTVQSELSNDPKKFSAITSELLGIGSSTLLDTLLAVDATTVSKDLNTLFDGIQKATISNVDTVQVGEKINVLNGLTKDVDQLKKGTDVKTVEDFKKKMGAAKNKIGFGALDLQGTSYEKVASALHTIMTVTPAADFVPMGKQKEALLLLKTEISTFCNNFESLGDKTKDSFNLLWSLRDGHVSLKPLLTVATAAKEFSSKIQNPASMSSDFSDMKKDVDTLKALLESSQNSTIGESLTALVKSLSSNKRGEKTLTNGFSNGISDIEQIFKDLKGSWLKKNIGDGGSIDKVADSLKRLKGLVPKWRALGDSWSKLSNNETSRQAAEFVSGLLIKTEESSKNVKAASTLSTSFGSMQVILKNLKPVGQLPDQAAVEALVAKYEPMNQKIATLEATFDEIAASTAFKNLRNLEQIENIVGDKTASDVVLNETNLIRGIQDAKELSELITKVTNQLMDVDLRGMGRFIDSEQNWALVNEVQKSLDNTDLVDVLEKIQKSTFDKIGTASFVSFASDVRAIKTAQTEVAATKTFMTDLTAVVTAGKAAKSSTQLVKARAPRQTTSRLDSHVAHQLGTAIQVLQNMAAVSEKKGKILGLANAKASVTTAVEAVAKDVWTDGNRKAMKDTVDEVEKLEKFVQKLSDDDWDTLIKVFDEAAKVKGVPIDSKMFADPIGVALEKSTDSDVKAAAGNFRDLSTLDMDFASKERDLKTASLTLNPIRDFFNQLLGTSGNNQVKEVVYVTEEPSSNLWMYVVIGILVAVIIIGGAAVIFCCLKNKKAKKEGTRLVEDEESKKKSGKKDDEGKEQKKESEGDK